MVHGVPAAGLPNDELALEVEGRADGSRMVRYRGKDMSPNLVHFLHSF